MCIALHRRFAGITILLILASAALRYPDKSKKALNGMNNNFTMELHSS